MERGLKEDEQEDRERGRDHIAEGPGGAAQFDTAQQTQRADVEAGDRKLERSGPPLRGTLPPAAAEAKSSKYGGDAPSPAVPGSAVDRGEKRTREGQLGA